MNDKNQQAELADADDIGHNQSNNPSFDAVLQARLNRRGVLRGGMGGAAALLFGGAAAASLTACNGGGGGASSAVSAGGSSSAGTTAPVTGPKFNFSAVAKNVNDALTLPPGYSYQVLYALGDPINATTGAYKNDGSDGDFEFRAGDHHDGMNYFGLNAAGTARDAAGSERGLLAMNHENITAAFLHAAGATSANGVRPQAEVDKEIAAHGLSVVEIQKVGGKFQLNRASGHNRRYTAQTPLELSGPAKGSAHVKTKYSADGSKARGTLNNCATGDTPWGTFLTCEENWAFYFARASGDDALRSANEVAAFKRYGISAGAKGNGWDTAGSSDSYKRWNLSKTGTSADGSDDFRNEANTFGYVVEVDPYNKTVSAKKRTALGRFAHECAVFPAPVVGKPVVFYMGDDSRNEYVYKFVSKALWDAADANKGMAAGDKYLDQGTLYVAKFNADGTGSWIALTMSNSAIASYSGYTFASAADIAVNTRLAADAVGATKMDRPEWCSVNPKNGEVYYTLTNNSNRVVASPSGSKLLPDAANPRAYEDLKGSKTQTGNVNGHILRTAEVGGDAASLSFNWDVYLFAAEAGADAAVNLSGLTADNDMSSPDGLAFGRNGLLWIQTDDGAYTDVTNCMMLAAIPGQVGDGGATKVVNKIGTGTLEVTTQKGKNPSTDTLRRFLVGPKGAEITGIAETPDGKTLFVNIQHPGEDTALADLADPTKYQSHWPAGGTARPRSATVVITRDDGGAIGIG